MNIYVLMKSTFDTEEKIAVVDGQIEEEGAEFIINPYDEYALEEAIVIRDDHGGEVTVVTVGDESVEKELRTALAMGADQAVRIGIESFNTTDEHSIATLLAAYLQKQSFDIILGGNVAIDGGSGQVAPRVAELLQIPQVTTITSIDIDDGEATIIRDVEGDEETVEVSLPLLVTAQQGLNEPRYPSLPGIMRAKRKPLHVLHMDELQVCAGDVAARTETVEVFLPKEKEAGTRIEGEPEQQVKELVSLLQSEAKVI